MAWCIGRSTDCNENDENNEDNDFDKNLKKVTECNEMKNGMVQVLKRKWWKERLRPKWQNVVECNDMKDDRVQVLQWKQWKWQKQWFGQEFP